MAKAATLKAVEKTARDEEDTDLPSVIEYDEDLSEAEAPEPLPVREYTATISGAKTRESAKGNKYVEVMFHIAADEYPADYEAGNPNGTILGYRRVSPASDQSARYGMRKFCEAIDAPLGKQVRLDDWVGKEAIVTIAHEPYEGVMRAAITKVRAA